MWLTTKLIETVQTDTTCSLFPVRTQAVLSVSESGGRVVDSDVTTRSRGLPIDWPVYVLVLYRAHTATATLIA